MKFTYFIGIDSAAAASQRTAASAVRFDVCLCSEEQPDQFMHEKFTNSAAGCKQPGAGRCLCGLKSIK